MKVILDSNIYISALALKSQKMQTLIDFCFLECEVCICSELIDEVKRISITKFDVKPNVLDQFSELYSSGIKFNILQLPKLSRDPKDAFLLGLAEKTKAQYLITGDKDLLELGYFKNTKILSPVKFLGEMTDV